MPPKVAIVGSTNLDLITRVHHLPRLGETILASGLSRAPGGKGANQALAVARQGVATTLIAAVGADPFADEALALLRAEPTMDLSRVTVLTDHGTGVALIAVDDDGNNTITVAPGANGAIVPAMADTAGFDAVICQFEIPEEVVEHLASTVGGLLCVNPSPSRPLSRAVVEHAAVIVVNETEAEDLADDLRAYKGLLVITQGPDGARVLRGGVEELRRSAPRVQAVDTVGAGDTFCGVLVSGLVQGMALGDAVERACAGGALAVTKPGAQPSIPTAEEIDAFLA